MKKIIIPRNIAKDEIEISLVDFSVSPCFIVELKSNKVIGMLISNHMSGNKKPKSKQPTIGGKELSLETIVTRYGIVSTNTKIAAFNFKTPMDALSSLDSTKYSFVIDLTI